MLEIAVKTCLNHTLPYLKIMNTWDNEILETLCLEKEVSLDSSSEG